MSLTVGLDFETFSSVDITEHGGSRYFEADDFTVLVGAVHYTDGSSETFDFVINPDAREQLQRVLKLARVIVAHNASFERAVCKFLGYDIQDHRFVDSAVIARAMGAAGSLEQAAPQLLNMDKMELGKSLIKIFSVPTADNGGKPYSAAELSRRPELMSQWRDFRFYCSKDAQLSLQLWVHWGDHVHPWEWRYERITQRMNDAGWFVDLPLVDELQRRYELNVQALHEEFHKAYGNINLASYKQLQKWCAERGMDIKSFDKQALPKLRRRIIKVLDAGSLSAQRQEQYNEVLDLIEIKIDLGGTSLSKLSTIQNHVGRDGRLRGQYLHIGAGQTYRTSGRGVQMQNLARLGAEPDDLEDLEIDPTYWSNTKLTQNIRQCFKAQDPNGSLIVGDFKSVESMGLAYQAGEEWKLQAYRDGKDVYKMLAATYQSFNGVAYDDVTKPQRQGGKLGELSCGYGAGPSAVKGFAEKMGIDMTEAEARTVVWDWRRADPRTVEYWSQLDSMLKTTLRTGKATHVVLPFGESITCDRFETPASLLKQQAGVQSIRITMTHSDGSAIFSRIFHGCYFADGDVRFFKPSEQKGGELWRARSATAPHYWLKLYGGKLAGILTQSFCREIFFQKLEEVDQWVRSSPQLQLIGQFHDEIVLEFTPTPNGMTLAEAEAGLKTVMTGLGQHPAFPLAADVHSAHRYIK